MDFSDNRDTLAGEKYKERFWAGVPNIPKKDKKSMAIYLMFLQHILYSLGDKARAAIVVPSGFLTDTGNIQTARLKKPELAEYVYNYLLLLYSRGYFFNLENNTTGIKNLIFSAFAKNIKVPLPKDLSVIQKYYAALDAYCNEL